MIAPSKQVSDGAPAEIEAMLPWHAAGTLSPRDARRVAEALGRDPALARQYAVIQDEYAETIRLNEDLGAPSSRAMQKLFAAIDAEPARTASASASLSARIGAFFAGLSPRTLATAAAVGALALLLQAGVIGTIVLKDGGRSGYQTASYQATPKPAGMAVLIRFVPDARVSDINTFLGNYGATIVDGPRAGTFRIVIGDTTLSKDDAARLMMRIQSDRIVGFAAAAD
jgi:hypothetical protein